MAHFHCSCCGHHESVPDALLHRLARCPECRNVQAIQDGSFLYNAFMVVNGFFRGWGGLALFGVGGVVVILATWGWVRPQRGDAGPQVAQAARFDGATSDKTKEAETVSRPVQSLAEDLKVPVAASPEDQLNIVDAERSLDSREPVTVVEQVTVVEPAQTEAVVIEVPLKVSPNTSPLQDEPPKLADPHTQQIADGKMLFEHQWVPNDPLAGGGDGLGPLFNARSCVECHFQGGIGGSGTKAHNVHSFEVLPAHYGAKVRDGVIHASAIDGSLQESKADLNERLGSPKVPFLRLKHNRKASFLEADAVRSVFMKTPALWGDGLIDQITNKDLYKLQHTHPSFGRFRQFLNGKIGRFGWKGQTATLRQFVGSACAAELGLSNSVRSQQKPHAYADDPRAHRDLTDDQVTALVNFVASLPTPQQVLPQDPTQRQSVQGGQKLFTKIGCATCHVPDVGPAHGVYSDFRLHFIDVATTKVETYYVVDAVPVFQPSGDYPKLGEWKTPPLWGLADTAPYWHDGSAQTITDAIQKHQEEGANSKAAFDSLDQEHQNQVLDFLKTLKAPNLQN